MTPLYNMYGNPPVNSQPMNRMQMVMQAMRNPVAVIKQKFPDIPDYMMNNPGQILQYLQQTRNITNNQLQNLFSQMR